MTLFWLCLAVGATFGLFKIWNEALLTEPYKTLQTEVFKTLLTVVQVAIIGSAAAVLLELFKNRQAAFTSLIDRRRRAAQDSRQAYDEIKTVRRLLKATREYSPLEEDMPPVDLQWAKERHSLLEEMGKRLMKTQLLLEFLQEQYPKESDVARAFKEMEKRINRVSKVMLQAGLKQGRLTSPEIAELNKFLGDDFDAVAEAYHRVVGILIE